MWVIYRKRAAANRIFRRPVLLLNSIHCSRLLRRIIYLPIIQIDCTTHNFYTKCFHHPPPEVLTVFQVLGVLPVQKKTKKVLISKKIPQCFVRAHEFSAPENWYICEHLDFYRIYVKKNTSYSKERRANDLENTKMVIFPYKPPLPWYQRRRSCSNEYTGTFRSLLGLTIIYRHRQYASERLIDILFGNFL